MSKVRTRFAPSPTGFLHIGGLRTALFAYLIAKSQGGEFLLRVEDTDQKRLVEGAMEKLFEIIAWVGLKFDEGPQEGGDHGPYIQSMRREQYAQHAEILLKTGRAYRCYCSAERLDAMRTEQARRHEPPRYDRACRYLLPEESARRAAAGERFVIRQAMPEEGTVTVHDEIRGDISFGAAELDDHVLIKSDGLPTYHFAVVTDDHDMAITDVVRGEEWIPSYPKNWLLYQAFGWNAPRFYHLPVVLNPGGGKLSKRQGDVAVEDFRTRGYLPEALLNFCALLGWHPKGNEEIMSLATIERHFKPADIGASPAIFDTAKLDHFNGVYLRHLEAEQLLDLVLPCLVKSGLVIPNEAGEYRNAATGAVLDRTWLGAALGLARERMKTLAEAPGLIAFLLADTLEYEAELLIWKKSDISKTLEIIKKLSIFFSNIKEFTKESLEIATMAWLGRESIGTGDALWPLRVALSGLKASPGPFEIAAVLGKETTLKRIDDAMNKLS